jgi:hypothetical protein
VKETVEIAERRQVAALQTTWQLSGEQPAGIPVTGAASPVYVRVE